MKNDVSVVIPTKNRLPYLRNVITSYLTQEKLKELIIIDDNSSDATIEYLKVIGNSNNRLIVLRNENGIGAPASRNKGVKNATGDFIFFGEDDLFLKPKTLITLYSHLIKSNADIISGRRIWMEENETYEKAYLRTLNKSSTPVNYKLIITDCQAMTEGDLEVPLLDASMLIRKAVFDSIEYDPFFAANAWREESDFQIQAKEKGYVLIYCPHVETYHLSKKRDRGGNHAQSLIKYEQSILGNTIYFVKKHKKYLSQNFDIKNIYIFFIRFFFYRLLDKNLVPFLVRTKRSIFSK